MRDKLNKLVDLTNTRQFHLAVGAIAGGAIILLIAKRPVILVGISDSIMREIIEANQ